jgi:hypothetical protein
MLGFALRDLATRAMPAAHRPTFTLGAYGFTRWSLAGAGLMAVLGRRAGRGGPCARAADGRGLPLLRLWSALYGVRSLRRLNARRCHQSGWPWGRPSAARATSWLIRAGYDKGRVKLKLGIAKGKKLSDKRETSAQRDWNRQKQRLLKQGG